MSDFDDQMAEWRKTLWATGPCPDSSQVNFTLTDEEREAISGAILEMDGIMQEFIPTPVEIRLRRQVSTLRNLLERTK